MAPKRARVAHGSSRRSQPPFGDNRFVSAIAYEEYTRLRTRSVAKERAFKPITTNGKLCEIMSNRDWHYFRASPPAVPLGIVREFYANAKAEKNGFSKVRQIMVDYRPAAIRAIVGQPAKPEGTIDWSLKNRADVHLDDILENLCVPGTQWRCNQGLRERISFPASAMNRYARALNLFICANLLPSSHSHDVTVDRAILLWGIITNEYIDLGNLLHQNMIRFMRGGTTGAIPHGSIVAQLCAAEGVTWGDEEQMQDPSSAIVPATIARMEEWPGGIPHERGLGYIIEETEEDRLPSQQPRVARAGSSRAAASQIERGADLSEVHYRRLTRRIDQVHAINRRFAEDLTLSLDRVFQSDGIEVDWPQFGGHHPYPPPDSPLGSPPEEGDDPRD